MKSLINFSIWTETVLRCVDASLNHRRLYLVNGLRPKAQAAGDLLRGTGRNELTVFAHRQNHHELISVLQLRCGRYTRFIQTADQKLHLITARVESLPAIQQLACLFVKSFA